MRQSGMGDPARGSGFQTEMYGVRSYDYGDETAGGEKHQRTQETGRHGRKVKAGEHFELPAVRLKNRTDCIDSIFAGAVIFYCVRGVSQIHGPALIVR